MFQTNGTTALKHITTCNLCNQRFSNNALPIIGDTPDKYTQAFVQALIIHLKKQHAEQFAAFTRNMVTLANQFAAWLALQSFDTEDPNLRTSMESLRTQVHRVTRKAAPPTDAEIIDKVARLGLDEAEAAPVAALCKEIRDLLAEEGRYAPASVIG